MRTFSNTKATSSSFWRSIQGNLVALFLLFLIPLIFVHAYVYHERLTSGRARELQENLEVARATARTFESFIRDLVHSELVLGMAFTASLPIAAEDRNRILHAFQADNPVARGVYWVEPGGTIIASSYRDFIGSDVRDRPFYQDIQAGKAWSISDLFIGKVTGIPTFTVARGILNEQGELMGIVALAVEPDRLGGVFGIERSMDAGVSLVDSKGMLVYRHPPTQYSWEERNWLKFYPMIEDAINGKEITSTVLSQLRGNRRMVAFAPVPSVGWVAAASRAEEDVMAQIRSAVLYQTLLSAMLTLCAFCAALLVARHISASIKQLRHQAMRLGSGEKETPVIPSGPSEIRDLADVFNEMVRRVRARESELMASEKKYRNLFHFVPDPLVLVLKDEGKVVAVNKAYSRLLEFSPDEVIGKRFEDLGLFSELYEQKSIWDILISNENIPDLECRVETKPGEIKTILLSSRFFDLLTSHAVLLAIKDITERKRMEDALSEKHRLSVRAQEIAKFGYWDRDFLTDRSVWSEGMYPIFGINPDEFEDSYEYFLSLIHPSDREFVNGSVESALSNRQKLDIEYRIMRPDGDERIIHSVAEPRFDDGGLAVGLFGIAQDITERKHAEQELRHSEERFRQLAENITKVFWVATPDISKMLYVSPAYERLWGRTCASLYANPRSWLDGIHPEDLPAVKDKLAERGTESLSMEFRIVHSDGSIRWILDRGFPVLDEAGEVYRFAGFSEDITTRKEAEGEIRKQGEQLRTLAARLAEAEEAERQHLARELHDQVGQDLSALGVNLSLIRALLPEGVSEGLLARLADSGVLLEETIALVRNLMADLRPPSLDDYGLLEALRWYGANFSQRTGITVEVAGEEPAPRLDPLEEISLFRIVQEALTNVTKHAQATRVTLTLEVEELLVRLTIADNGVGFDQGPERLKDLTGWGLITMKERAWGVGGECRVESRPDHGTCVVVEVPR